MIDQSLLISVLVKTLWYIPLRKSRTCYSELLKVIGLLGAWHLWQRFMGLQVSICIKCIGVLDSRIFLWALGNKWFCLLFLGCIKFLESYYLQDGEWRDNCCGLMVMNNWSVLGCWYREFITLIGLILSFHLIIVLLSFTVKSSSNSMKPKACYSNSLNNQADNANLYHVVTKM